MSSLAFGHSTRFPEGEETEAASKILKNFQDGIVAVGALLQVPWILATLKGIYFARPMMEFNS